MSISELEKLMTVKEVMEHLRIGRSTLHKLVREGKIKAVKWNRKTLFRASTLQAFIEASEQSVEPAKLVRDL